MRYRTVIAIIATTISLQSEAEETKKADDNNGKPVITFAGLWQVHGRAYAEQTGPGTPLANTLALRRGEIRIVGTFTPRVSGWIMIDPAKQLGANGNGVTQSTNILQEVVLTYKITDTVLVDAGQYKIPLGYEGDQVGSGATQNVERALMYQTRDPLGGGNGDVRDAGIRLRGSHHGLEYDLGWFNGLGERQNTTATTDSRPLVARLIYNLPLAKGLRLGVGHAEAPRSTGLHRRLTNAFAVYKSGRATLQSELLTGETRYPVRGWYGHAGWLITPRVEATARYDVFDFNRHSPGDSAVRDLIGGVNYYLKANSVKIQANLLRRNGGKGLLAADGYWANAVSFSQSNVQLRLNFQVSF